MQPYPPPPQFAPPAPAPQKKSVLPWVLGGCGVLLVLAIIVSAIVGFFIYKTGKEFANSPTRAAAKIIEIADKNIEIVSVDEEKKQITFKDKRTGRVETVTLDELQRRANQDQQAGRGGGDEAGGGGSETANADLPDWVPMYPGAEVTQTSSSEIGGARTTAITFKTGDSVEDVVGFYEQALRKAKFNVTKNATQTNGVEYRTVVGYVASRNGMQSVAVSAYVSPDDETMATLAYTQKGR
jgi:hypothetical protein